MAVVDLRGRGSREGEPPGVLLIEKVMTGWGAGRAAGIQGNYFHRVLRSEKGGVLTNSPKREFNWWV